MLLNYNKVTIKIHNYIINPKFINILILKVQIKEYQEQNINLIKIHAMTT